MKEGNINKGGFRTLSNEEVDAISGSGSFEGGFITVTGNPFRQNGEGYGGGGGGYGLSESNGISDHQQLGDGGGGIVVTAPDFNPTQDHCGSAGPTAIVPDVVLGVNISYACFLHDLAYSEGSDLSRYQADLDFLRDINNILVFNGVDAIEAAAIAFIYFQGVREVGLAFYEGTGNSI